MNEFYNVFIDTNVLQWRIFNFDTPELLALKFYLENTKTKAYTSNVVLEELKNNYKTDINNKVSELKENIKGLSNLDFWKKLNLQDIISDDLITHFNNRHIKKLFFIKTLPTRQERFDECLKRTIHKIHPCHEKEEFKDTVIWLTFLDILKETNENFVFITNNVKDFWKDWILLNYLQGDIDWIGWDVKYYSWNDPLKRFLEDYSKKYAPILDKDKILEIFPEEEAIQSLSSYSSRDLSQFIKNSYRYDIEDIELFRWPELNEVYDIFITEKNDERIVFSFTMSFDIGFEVYVDWFTLYCDEIFEYLYWDIIYNIKKEKYEIDYDNLIYDHDTVNIEYDLNNKIEERYRNK